MKIVAFLLIAYQIDYGICLPLQEQSIHAVNSTVSKNSPYNPNNPNNPYSPYNENYNNGGDGQYNNNPYSPYQNPYLTTTTKPLYPILYPPVHPTPNYNQVPVNQPYHPLPTYQPYHPLPTTTPYHSLPTRTYTTTPNPYNRNYTQTTLPTSHYNNRNLNDNRFGSNYQPYGQLGPVTTYTTRFTTHIPAYNPTGQYNRTGQTFPYRNTPPTQTPQNFNNYNNRDGTFNRDPYSPQRPLGDTSVKGGLQNPQISPYNQNNNNFYNNDNTQSRFNPSNLNQYSDSHYPALAQFPGSGSSGSHFNYENHIKNSPDNPNSNRFSYYDQPVPLAPFPA